MSLYEDLAAEQLARPEVGLGRSLRNETLTVGGKIFAFAKDDDLIVKLPAARVADLAAKGEAEPFVNAGRTMKEWARVPPSDAATWRALLEEARHFVQR